MCLSSQHPRTRAPPPPSAALWGGGGRKEPLPSFMHLVPVPQVLTFQNILPDPHAHPGGKRSWVLRTEMSHLPNSSAGPC